MAAVGISQSGGFASDSTKAKASAASVFAILDRKSKVDPDDESGTTLDNVNGEIEFRHVSFKYPLRPDIQIVQDLNLIIQPGQVYTFPHEILVPNHYHIVINSIHPFYFQTVALVGESGSGKSTVIAMLQRFYDPNSGDILLDGMEIQKLQLRWLRQQMGLVSQEPVLFNDTIKANIAYGKSGTATESEIQAAAGLANAHNFISSLQQVCHHSSLLNLHIQTVLT